MVSEITIDRLENALTEVIDFSDTKEQTKIVSNMEVVNASPTGLTGFITIKDNRDGDTILATTIPGVVYTAGDLVNVLFIDGTEPIGFQQASESVSTNGLWQLQGGTGPAIVYDDGNVGIGKSAAPDATLEVLSTSTQLRITHTEDTTHVTFTLDTNHDLTITPTSTGQVIFQPTTDSVDFFQVLDADGGAPVLNIDSTNERVGVGIAAPLTLLHVFSPSTGAIARLETDQVNGVARFELINDVKQWNVGVNSSDALTLFDANTGFTPLYLDPNPTKSFMVRINVNEVVVNDNSGDADFRVESNGDTHNIFSEGGTDRVGIGENVPLAKLHVDQASTTAAIPVVYWDQADVSEEFVKLVGTAASAVTELNLQQENTSGTLYPT